jgi:hypothetical protein
LIRRSEEKKTAAPEGGKDHEVSRSDRSYEP